MSSENDRESLRQTFDGVAGSYHRARPDYPAELFDDLVRVTQLAAGSRLLEVGCATGTATLPLARRGFRITCVELGADLAAAARANAAGFDVEMVEAAFELRDYTQEITASGRFDPVHIRHFDWERRYNAEQYIGLLNTFSGHIAMDDWQRNRLYREIRQRLARRPDQTLRRHWGAALRIARRRDRP